MGKKEKYERIADWPLSAIAGRIIDLEHLGDEEYDVIGIAPGVRVGEMLEKLQTADQVVGRLNYALGPARHHTNVLLVCINGEPTDKVVVEIDGYDPKDGNTEVTNEVHLYLSDYAEDDSDAETQVA